mmetsp:Transcript_68436/g.177746  ORF Transcript_68436/g.177746 Transcript_68436/m.177746 type:complete len:278 (-) Transcript_68436:37-870(-)
MRREAIHYILHLLVTCICQARQVQLHVRARAVRRDCAGESRPHRRRCRERAPEERAGEEATQPCVDFHIVGVLLRWDSLQVESGDAVQDVISVRGHRGLSLTDIEGQASLDEVHREAALASCFPGHPGACALALQALLRRREAPRDELDTLFVACDHIQRGFSMLQTTRLLERTPDTHKRHPGLAVLSTPIEDEQHFEVRNLQCFVEARLAGVGANFLSERVLAICIGTHPKSGIFKKLTHGNSEFHTPEEVQHWFPPPMADEPIWRLSTVSKHFDH